MTGRLLQLALFACCLWALGGCTLFKKPDKANIELRKQNQNLEAVIKDLEHKSAGDAAMIDSLQNRVGTLPTLPRERLAKLFTTHDIKLGRLTGGADLDVSKPGQEGLKIFVTPVDETGDALKAAGSFIVEAFDLSRENKPKIGTWTVEGDTAKQAWSSVLNRANYVLTLPWQTVPKGETLHLEITFIDELTQARFRKTIDVAVQPPCE